MLFSWSSLGILGDFFTTINTHTIYRACIYRDFPIHHGPTLGCTILVHPSAYSPLRLCTSREASLHQVVPAQSPFAAAPPDEAKANQGDRSVDRWPFVFSTSMGCAMVFWMGMGNGNKIFWKFPPVFNTYVGNQKSWKSTEGQNRSKYGHPLHTKWIDFTQPSFPEFFGNPQPIFSYQHDLESNPTETNTFSGCLRYQVGIFVFERSFLSGHFRDTSASQQLCAVFAHLQQLFHLNIQYLKYPIYPPWNGQHQKRTWNFRPQKEVESSETTIYQFIHFFRCKELLLSGRVNW